MFATPCQVSVAILIGQLRRWKLKEAWVSCSQSHGPSLGEPGAHLRLLDSRTQILDHPCVIICCHGNAVQQMPAEPPRQAAVAMGALCSPVWGDTGAAVLTHMSRAG